jgi:hypothetical protein
MKVKRIKDVVIPALVLMKEFESSLVRLTNVMARIAA